MKKHAVHIFIYIIFLVGVAGHATESLIDIMVSITSVTLLIMGSLVLYQSVRANGAGVLIWAGATYVVTFFLEVLGVRTGLVFGGYEYGHALAPLLFDVPLIIGYNWVFVILGAACIVHRYLTRPFPFAIMTASITVLFDILLEPVAIQLGYWQWGVGYVPLQNYVAWFAISFTAAYFLKLSRIRFYTEAAIHYFIAQGLFFTALNLLL